MAAICGLLLAALAGWNYRMGRNVLYPPFLFCVTWAATLVALALAGKQYYSLGIDTAAIFVTGAAMFSLGGAAMRSVLHNSKFQARPSQVNYRCLRYILWPMLLLLGYGLWRYISWVRGLISVADLSTYLIALRVKMVAIGDNAATGDLVLLNLPPMAQIIGLIAWHGMSERRLSRTLAWLLVIVALCFQLLSTSRTGLTMFLCGLATISVLTRKRIPKRAIIAIGSGLLVLFCSYDIYLRKSGEDPNLPLSENVARAATGLQAYWLGGAVAFDQVPREPSLVSSWSLSTPVRTLLVRLGLDIPVPTRNLTPVMISDSQMTNVYTMYAAYYSDLGVWGALLLPLVTGALCTCAYVLAVRGVFTARILLGLATYGVVMSVFAEVCLMEINMWIRCVLVVAVLQALAAAFGRGRTVQRYSLPGSQAHHPGRCLMF